MTHSKKVINQIKEICHTAFTGAGIALVIFAVGHITGCNTFVAAQAEQDIATSTSAPLTAYQEDMGLIEFQNQAKYANDKLATMKAYAKGEAQ